MAIRDYQEAVSVAKDIDAISDAARLARQLSLAFTEQNNSIEAESWNRQADSLSAVLKQKGDPLDLKMNTTAIAKGEGNRAEAERLYRVLVAQSSALPYLEWTAGCL